MRQRAMEVGAPLRVEGVEHRFANAIVEALDLLAAPARTNPSLAVKSVEAIVEGSVGGSRGRREDTPRGGTAGQGQTARGRPGGPRFGDVIDVGDVDYERPEDPPELES